MAVFNMGSSQKIGIDTMKAQATEDINGGDLVTVITPIVEVKEGSYLKISGVAGGAAAVSCTEDKETLAVYVRSTNIVYICNRTGYLAYTASCSFNVVGDWATYLKISNDKLSVFCVERTAETNYTTLVSYTRETATSTTFRRLVQRNSLDYRMWGRVELSSNDNLVTCEVLGLNTELTDTYMGIRGQSGQTYSWARAPEAVNAKFKAWGSEYLVFTSPANYRGVYRFDPQTRKFSNYRILQWAREGHLYMRKNGSILMKIANGNNEERLAITRIAAAPDISPNFFAMHETKGYGHIVDYLRRAGLFFEFNGAPIIVSKTEHNLSIETYIEDKSIAGRSRVKNLYKTSMFAEDGVMIDDVLCINAYSSPDNTQRIIQLKIETKTQVKKGIDRLALNDIAYGYVKNDIRKGDVGNVDVLSYTETDEWFTG